MSNFRRRLMMSVKKQNEYTELEYIESTGTQYIDTEYYNNPNTKVDITFMYLKSNGDAYSNGMIYGSADTYNGRPSYSIGLTTENKIYYRNSNSAESFTNYSISSNQKINVITDKTSITIDGNTYQHNMSLITNNALFSSYIFARHQLTDSSFVHVNDAYNPLIGRIYSCKIYDNDVLIRDMIPVLDKNGTACMYDKVNKKFYYNSGTGDFLYGEKES